MPRRSRYSREISRKKPLFCVLLTNDTVLEYFVDRNSINCDRLCRRQCCIANRFEFDTADIRFGVDCCHWIVVVRRPNLNSTIIGTWRQKFRVRRAKINTPRAFFMFLCQNQLKKQQKTTRFTWKVRTFCAVAMSQMVTNPS